MEFRQQNTKLDIKQVDLSNGKAHLRYLEDEGKLVLVRNSPGVLSISMAVVIAEFTGRRAENLRFGMG